MRRVASILRRLEHPRAPLIAAALGVLLCLPALFNGLVLDDHLQHVMATDLSQTAPLLQRAPWDLYAFFPNDPDWDAAAREAGAVPWYAASELTAHFARPLSSLLLWAEWQLGVPRWLAHAHDLLWYGALIWLSARVYREVYGAVGARDASPAAVAGLAALIYACADGHGLAVGWTANRHACVSLVFATAALLAHVRWRAHGDRAAGFAAPALFAVALASGETALSITAYLFAWAVCMERDTRARLTSLAPCFVVSVVWLAWYRAGGYGTSASGLYLNPASEPARFLAALPERWTLLMGAAVSPLQSDLAMIFRGSGYAALVAASGACILGVAAWAGSVLRSRSAAVFALGAAVALLPVCGVFASDRNLFVATLGIAPVLAELIAHGARADAGAWARRGAMLMVVVHLLLVPLNKPLRTRSSVWIGDMSERACLSLDDVYDDLGGRELVVVTAPDFFFGPVAVLAMRPSLGLPTPAAMRSLHTGTGDVTVTRTDERTLELRTTTRAVDALLDETIRHPDDRFVPGEQIGAGGWTVTILDVDERGGATALRWEAPTSLDDPERRWVFFGGRGYQAFDMLAVGASTQLPGTSTLEALAYGMGLSR